MKGYKGFSHGLVCRGKQYAENTTFEEDSAVVCKSGMHFCASPFDVLDYYGFVSEYGSFNDFAEVEALDEAKTDDGQKFCTTKLKVGVKLPFPGFVKACVDFVLEKTKHSGTIGSSGNDAQIGSSGNGAKIGSSGHGAQIGSSGNGAQIGSSGHYAQVGSSGNYAKIGSSGNYAKIGSSGADSVICCVGHSCRVKAKRGSWITLAEWEFSEEKRHFVPAYVKTEFVDGERIKSGVFYMLKNGEFVEC